MGSCCSKTNDPSSSSSLDQIVNDSPSVKPKDLKKPTIETQKIETEQQKIEDKKVLKPDEGEETRKKIREEGEEDQGKVKKEFSMIKHRKSHDRSKTTDPMASSEEAEEKSSENDRNSCRLNPNGVVRTSSCTKEEVDAILIQCGRLSRSNSSDTKTRRYSGSKRSFDFDQNEKSCDRDASNTVDVENGEDERRLNRTRHRQSGVDRANASPRERRRRTPSREREEPKNHRSGSRERGNGGSSSRRVSRSPGRRSENNPSSGSGGSTVYSGNNRAGSGNSGGGSAVNAGNIRPGKMVSVPATDKTTTLPLDKSKSNTAEPSIKRITAKRNAAGEGSRTAASPRSQSPVRAANANQLPMSLSRSSSRKGEQSPYRRNPLDEIDPNSLAYPQSNGNKTGSANGNGNKKMMSRENDGQPTIKGSAHFADQKASSGLNNNSRTAPQSTNCRAASPNRSTRQHQEVAEASRMTVTGTEVPKPQALTRSRSSRKSRDFDVNPEAVSNKNNNSAPSYTVLLLEDIQNFHQKSTNVPFTVPQCVTKACSILEAVADLNSTTSTSPVPDQNRKNEYKFSSYTNRSIVTDDLMEPSFEKYVTVKRGGSLEDMEEQESSGSNSYTGSNSGLNHQWGISSSSWEPNSADSTDRWSSRSNHTKKPDQSPLRFQSNDANLNKIQFDPLENGIGRGRVGPGKSVQTALPHAVAAAASM